MPATTMAGVEVFAALSAALVVDDRRPDAPPPTRERRALRVVASLVEEPDPHVVAGPAASGRSHCPGRGARATRARAPRSPAAQTSHTPSCFSEFAATARDPRRVPIH